MTLAEEITDYLNDGVWTTHKSNPGIIEDWESRREVPDEGIKVIDDDVDTEDGRDTYGTILYERQVATLLLWSTTKAMRDEIKNDIIAILAAADVRIYCSGWIPKAYGISKYGYEMRFLRTDC